MGSREGYGSPQRLPLMTTDTFPIEITGQYECRSGRGEGENETVNNFSKLLNILLNIIIYGEND